MRIGECDPPHASGSNICFLGGSTETFDVGLSDLSPQP